MKKLPKKVHRNVTTNDIMDFLVENMATKEELRYEIGKLRSEMIDYIGKQIKDLKVDLSILIRQNDRKVTLLLDILLANKIITTAQAKKVHSLSVA